MNTAISIVLPTARDRDRSPRKAIRSLEEKGEKGNGRVIDRFEIDIDAIGDFKLMSVIPLQELKIQEISIPKL